MRDLKKNLNRREFARIFGAAGLAGAGGALGVARPASGQGSVAKKGARVIIIGGGIGGATVAHHLKKAAPDLEVVLIEKKKRYTTCFFSNWYLAGLRSFDQITHDYNGLVKLGVKVVIDKVLEVDATKKRVKLAGGGFRHFDRLVISPGIDFKWETIENYDARQAETMPHAWIAGPQTKTLKAQLMAMEDGGTVIVSPPPNPYRCPPGPYERISLIAFYLQKHKPKSKILVLDPKPKFSKMALFQAAWESYYPNMIEWVPPNMTGGGVLKVKPKDKMVVTGDGEKHKGDVFNIIPAQKASKLLIRAGLADGDWVPIDPKSFAARRAKYVYVLGDSANAAKMPKSGFAANSQAKVVANAVIADLGLGKRYPAKFRNTCWSALSDRDAVKVGASYKAGDKLVEVTSKFISKVGEDAELREKTFREAESWYSSITNDSFAKG